MILTQSRVDEVVASTHRVTSRIEIWSRNKRIVTDAPHAGGSESDVWQSGPRRTLNLTVPRDAWAAWLNLPKLEVKVFRGLIAGESTFETARGVFVVDPPPIGQDPFVQIQAKDRWVLVEDADFPGPVPAYRGQPPPGWVSITAVKDGRIKTIVAQLIQEATGLPVLISATSQAMQRGMDLWEKSRSETALELLTAISAEGYFDENGQARIRDQAPVPTGIVLKDGDKGTVVSVVKTTDWSRAYNTWAVWSSNPDVRFRTVLVGLPATHPASVQNRRKKLRRYASPLFENRDQAVQAALTMMARESMPTLSYVITCSPNPTLRAGHRIQVVTQQFGTDTCVVTKVDTPIGLGPQTVTAAVE